jgi:streptogramin lyase
VHPTSHVVELTKDNTKACKSLRGGSLRCVFPISEPVGVDTFTINLYESLDGAGKPLSAATLQTPLIQVGRTVAIPLVTGGVVAKIVPSTTALSAVQDGANHVLSFTVTAQDASGETIIGPDDYAFPITYKIKNDPYGALVPPSTFGMSQSQSTFSVIYQSINTLTAAQILLTSKSAKTVSIGVYPLMVAPANPYGGPPNALSGFFLASNSARPQSMTVSEANDIAPYVISASTPSVNVGCSPSSCAPASAGAAVQLSFTPVAQGAGTITLSDALGTQYSLPYRVSGWSSISDIGSLGQPDDLVLGPDGNFWSIVQAGSHTGNGWFVKVSPTGVATPYPLPSPFNPDNTAPAAASGPDNAIWFGDGVTPYAYRLSTANATVGQVTSYATSDGASPTSFVAGVDHQTMYFTDTKGNVGTINTSNDSLSSYANASAAGSAGSSLSIDPTTGNLYYNAGNTTYQMTPTGSFQQLNPPSFGYGRFYPPSNVVFGPDGALWVGTQYGVVCRETTVGKTLGCYNVALTYSLLNIVVGPDGAIWASGVNGNQYSAFSRIATSGEVTDYVALDCCAVPNDMVDGTDGALWTASSSGIDRIVP